MRGIPRRYQEKHTESYRESRDSDSPKLSFYSIGEALFTKEPNGCDLI